MALRKITPPSEAEKLAREYGPMQDTEKILIVNISPNVQMVPVHVGRIIRKMYISPFACVLANPYWQNLLTVSRYRDGNRDYAHVWEILRWVDLGLDLVSEDVEIPRKPVIRDDEGDVTEAYRMWWQDVSRLPLDLDKVAKLFDPINVRHDWNAGREPRGVPTLTVEQAQVWLNVYTHTGKTWIEGYCDMLANEDGERNDGKMFVFDVAKVRDYALKRIHHLDEKLRDRHAAMPSNPLTGRAARRHAARRG